MKFLFCAHGGGGIEDVLLLDGLSEWVILMGVSGLSKL